MRRLGQVDFDAIVIGGGIQGTGLLHDLSSRRISAHLLEERALSIGTSSRSTKLIHGGLRYLERFSQWPLVREALQERALLLRILGQLVKPIPFVLPVYRKDRPRWLTRVGLELYDFLAGDSGLPRSRSLDKQTLRDLAPYIPERKLGDDFLAAFCFYDAQMIDDAIVRVAAYAACKLGGSFEENCPVDKITPLTNGGFRVEGRRTPQSSQAYTEHFTYTCRTIIVTTGAWNNANLVRWGIAPKIPCMLNAGTHLVLNQAATGFSPDGCAATLVQNADGRVMFFIPWFGQWLFGTTERPILSDPRSISPSQAELDYLYKGLSENFDLNDPVANTTETFCGIRTMPMNGAQLDITMSENLLANPFSSPLYVESSPANMTRLSRESVISEPIKDLLVVYGGKYTTFRAQAEQIGWKIKERIGRGSHSLTRSHEAWFIEKLLEEHPEIFKSARNLRSA